MGIFSLMVPFILQQQQVLHVGQQHRLHHLQRLLLGGVQQQAGDEVEARVCELAGSTRTGTRMSPEMQWFPLMTTVRSRWWCWPRGRARAEPAKGRWVCWQGG